MPAEETHQGGDRDNMGACWLLPYGLKAVILCLPDTMHRPNHFLKAKYCRRKYVKLMSKTMVRT